MTKNRVSQNIFLLFLLTILVVLLTWNINIPYVGLHESCNLWYGKIAKNYQAKGFIETKFAPYISIDPDILYFNHPILLSLLVGLANNTFGFENYIGRLIPITFSFFAIIFLYLLVKDVWNKKIALLSVFFATFFPMQIMFGKFINYEPVVSFFIIFSLYILVQYKKQKKTSLLILLTLGLFLGMMADWPGYLFAGILFIYEFFIEKNRKLALYLLLTILLSLSLFLGYIYYVQGNIDNLINAFLIRSSIKEFGRGVEFDYGKWLLTIGLRLIVYFSPISIVLSAYAVFVSATQKHKIEKQQLAVLIILFSYALLYAVIFKEGSYIHNFWIYHFIYFLSITGAIGLYHLQKYKKIQILLMVLFIFSSMTVIYTLKKYEEKNIELYYLLEQVVKKENFSKDERVPVIFLRQFESMLLPYYFDVNINEIFHLKGLKEVINSHKNQTMISISDQFSHNKIFSEMNKLLKNNYTFKKLSGNRFEVCVFNLFEKRTPQDKKSAAALPPPPKAHKVSFINKVILPVYKKIIEFFGVPEI